MSVIEVDSKSVEVNNGESLLDELLRLGYFVDNPCSGMGTCGKCRVKLLNSSEIEMSESESRLLSEEDIKEGIRLSCFIDCKEGLKVKLLKKEKEGKVLLHGYLPEFEIDKNRNGYGFAVDIGTTTVVCELVSLKDGNVLGSKSMINPQKVYGLDVLTRITHEYENESGISNLQNAIVTALKNMCLSLIYENGIDKEEVSEMVVGANTSMLHFLLGEDAKSMGKFPYEPVFKKSRDILAKDIGLDINNHMRVYTLPNVSAFIGSDIVAGAYICDLEHSHGNVLFIDIGTNGEIVLKTNEGLVCCSCAAGPALEGMNISCGMRAESGAIEDLIINQDEVILKTIDDEKPEGLCGSGILAAVRELVKTGIVLKSGAFIKKEKMEEDDYRQKYILMNQNKREFLLCDNPRMIITQGDIRQVQLAKGAILSGFMALLKHFDIEMADLDKVLIAGQFGAHLPVESLVGAGILPKETKDKIVYVGNTSKTGAYMALLSKKVKEEMSELAEKMHYLELAVTEGYEKIFRDSMQF